VATIRLTSTGGRKVEFVDKMIGQGGMKDVFMSPDRTYVVAFFRDKLDAAGRDRLESIVGPYHDGIFGKEGGDYWRDLFCWPTDIVSHDGRIGVVTPVYGGTFFFEFGSINGDSLGIKGKEKEGKWFASASNRSKFLDPRERGSWLTHLRLSLMISRAVRRLHAAGLAHSDLSYKNVLVDPTTGTACIIDIDGLVVPGKFPPDVVGTPDFIAPEVVATSHLPIKDPARKLPSALTDRHALAVLIYMYLFYRHPLRGGRILDQDPGIDEELTMGSKALFIEHPTDASNRVKPLHLSASELPWGDPSKMPFTMAGPVLADLFKRAFVDGLHDPNSRPLPAEWENAIVRTTDLLQPCSNSSCEMKWYVFDNKTKPVCPRCGTAYQGKLPVLNLYSSRQAGSYKAEQHRVMVWDGQSLYQWHVNRNVFPSERLSDDQKKRVGYFRLHNAEWVLVNESLTGMKDLGEDRDIAIGDFAYLRQDSKILLSSEEGGRLIHVQIAGD
jgi:serine/threonine protein kinase